MNYGSQPVAVWVDGVPYHSQKAAERAFGMPKGSVSAQRNHARMHGRAYAATKYGVLTWEPEE